VGAVSTLLVLDGTNLVHRAYHAMAGTDMRTNDGDPVWALHGLVNLTAKFLTAAEPTSLLVAFDSPGGCPWRRGLVPEYKAGRAKSDPELSAQLSAAPELLRSAGLAVSEVPDWEADDIMASAVTAATAAGAFSVAVSSDKDLHQLVAERCVVYKPEGVWVDTDALMAKYGVNGARWVEFAALCGESSDNLSGVPGVGPKRAAALIAAFDDIEDALADPAAATSAVGAAVATKLAAGVDAFRRNRTVATLRRDLELDFAAVKLTRVDPASVRDVLTVAGLPAAGARLASVLSALPAARAA
jgi:5'-3' exonuclease